MIAPTPFFADRGCHVHVAEQAWALRRRGHDVLVATYGIGRDLPHIRTARTWKFPWYKRESIGPSWHKFYVDIFLLFTVLRAAWKFQPDVLHAHLHEGCLLGWFTRLFFGIPLVFDCQGSLTGELIAHNFPLVGSPWMQTAWYRLERWIDRQADVILAQSTEMERELRQRFKISKHKIHMAYDGVNTFTFKPRQYDRALARRLNIPSGKKIIVYLGGLTPHKGADILLKAFQEVRAKIPDSFLLLMGYPNEDRYRHQAQLLGLNQDICITGRVPYENAPQYLSLGHIAVAPKRTQTEANGKIYNYMAAGLPTIAFDTVVNRNILGELGAYVSDSSDAPALAEAMIKLLQSENLRQQLSERGRRHAVQHYSWDNVAKRIEDAYESSHIPWQLQVFQVSIRKKEKWQWVQSQLQSHINPTSRCLDIGAGVGTLSTLQEQLGGMWEFIETDSAAAGELRQVVSGRVYQEDIFSNSLPQQSYDIITVLDVIEHVSNPAAFLGRIQKLLAPGGIVICTTPTDDGKFYFWRRTAEVVFGIDKEAHDHEVEGFSGKQLRDLFTGVNLSLLKIEQFSFWFTELIELAYNGAYILKNRRLQSTRGYNVALSPASGADVARNRKQLMYLRIIYPLLRGISLLDRIVPWRRGYEWGVVARYE